MSKLYVKATTDAIKTVKTARGHHDAEVSILWNWGGNVPAGSATLWAVHQDGKVVFNLTIRNTTTGDLIDHHVATVKEGV